MYRYIVCMYTYEEGEIKREEERKGAVVTSNEKHTHVCMCVCVHACMCAGTYACTHACVCVLTVCIFLCMYHPRFRYISYPELTVRDEKLLVDARLTERIFLRRDTDQS